MNIYYITGFKGRYPVGTSAIIVAVDMYRAREILESELKKIGLAQHIEIKNISELECRTESVTILQDGDY